MAKIQNVNYEAIPAQAKQIRTYAQDLNQELTTAYQRITDMHENWYGTRYNELVKDFNTIIPVINEMLELVVGEIPFALETIANNYSQADRAANVTSAAKTAPKKISNIAVRNDVGMKFLTNEVTTVKNNVETNIKNAKEKMNQIESAYSRIEWNSEASQAFKTKFEKLKTKIIAEFDNIQSEFTRLMTKTLEDVQRAESSNTVS